MNAEIILKDSDSTSEQNLKIVNRRYKGLKKFVKHMQHKLFISNFFNTHLKNKWRKNIPAFGGIK